MLFELLEGPLWKTWDRIPKPDKVIPLPIFPTAIHATLQERIAMCSMAGTFGRAFRPECEKSVEDVRTPKDVLDAPQPKDANGNPVADVCMLGLTARPAADALAILDKLPAERWCRYCRGFQGKLLLSIGEAAAPALARLVTTSNDTTLLLFRFTDTPLVFGPLLEACLSSESRRDDARRHMRRFPKGTASLAIAIAAGADPTPLGIPAVHERNHWGDPRPCAAIRAGIMISVFARIGCEAEVLEAARELGLEATAKRWIRTPVVTPMEYGRPNPRLALPRGTTLEGKKLNAENQKRLLALLARIEWPLASRDIDAIRKALDPKTRAKIASSFATRWKRRTGDSWVATTAMVLDPSRAKELADPATVASSSDSYKQRNVDTSAVDAIADAAILLPDQREDMLASLGKIALDPVKARAHMSRRANQLLVSVAESLGLPAETLDDRTIPTLGLGANASTTLDWGGRPVEVRMTPALEIVFIVDGEKRSGQPSPRKGDAAKKVALAKKQVEKLRKDGRVLAHGLAPRVACWIRDRQRWSMDDFRANVLGHPILRAVAQGFVWATYDDGPFGGACTASFRIAEDGSFADVNEDAIAGAKGRVGLLHPAEVDGEIARKWGGIMADYELLPLVPQLADPRAFSAEQAAALEIGRDLAQASWRGSHADMPHGWTHVRMPSSSAWQRLVGEHRLVVQLFLNNARRITLSALRADSWRATFIKLGDLGRVAAHEALCDFDEMASIVEKAG